jgi:GrpB-like predicted nucleotidyltransferase (UPF0157 family)
MSYEEEARRLRDLVGPHIIDVQHIGSTSIPGMMAKPIIDIGIAIARFEDGEACIAPIESLGYEYRGEHGIPRRHYFVKGNPTSHHLHILERDSAEWENHLLFRDYLRVHSGAACAYARLKRGLADAHREDRVAYTDGKAAFIERVLRAAESGVEWGQEVR